jgi:hypothetical protein
MALVDVDYGTTDRPWPPFSAWWGALDRRGEPSS